MLRLNGVSFNLYFSSFFISLGLFYFVMYVGLLVTIQAFSVASLTIAPAFGTLALLYFIYLPSALIYAGALSYIFDKAETARQFYVNLSTTIGFITYTAVSIVDILVPDSPVSTILHVVFTITMPFYLPFGILYYINKVYLDCSLRNVCDTLTSADYMTMEIVLMFVMCILNIFIYYLILRIADTYKTGGSIREALFMKVNIYIYIS